MRRRFFVAFVALMMSVFGYAQGSYQLQNAGFEDWDNETTTSIEPSHWNSFMTATGTWRGTVEAQQLEKSTDVRPGTSGSTSVKIYARNVIFAIAQGNITTGQINAGSMTADDAEGNYNFTNTAGDDFNQKITGLPDSMIVWMNTSVSRSAKVSCILHTNGYYQDPEANNITATVICKASFTGAPTSWERESIPFTYTTTGGTRPAYALVTFTTSDTPGQGNKADYALFDDIEFIYNSSLKTATYDGATVTFTDMAATINGAYDKSKLALVADGMGATIETNYKDQVLTITVLGDNITENSSNKHVYTITFTKKNAEDMTRGFTEREFTKDVLCTVCLPFNISATEAAALGKFYVLGGRNGQQVYFTPEESVTANRPYVFCPAASGKLLSNFSMTVDYAPTSDSADGVDFIGVADKMQLESDAKVTYYGFVQGTGTFVKANTATVDIYRAYVSMATTSAAPLNELDVVLVDPTGIGSVSTAPTAGEIYNIQGMRVSRMEKGKIYIVDGKKVVK